MASQTTRTEGCSGCLLEAIKRYDERRERELLSAANVEYSDTYWVSRAQLNRFVVPFPNSFGHFPVLFAYSLKLQHQCAHPVDEDFLNIAVRCAGVNALHYTRIQCLPNGRRVSQIWHERASHFSSEAEHNWLEHCNCGFGSNGPVARKEDRHRWPELIPTAEDSRIKLLFSESGNGPAGNWYKFHWLLVRLSRKRCTFLPLQPLLSQLATVTSIGLTLSVATTGALESVVPRGPLLVHQRTRWCYYFSSFEFH